MVPSRGARTPGLRIIPVVPSCAVRGVSLSQSSGLEADFQPLMASPCLLVDRPSCSVGRFSSWLIGVAVGLGREASAVLGTGLALVILAILPQVGSPAEAQERPREPSDTRRDDAVPSHNP